VLTVVGAARAGNPPPMTSAGEPRRLGLEVRFDAEPIEGRVFDDDPGARLDRSFSGWLGLMAAIDAARTAERRTAPQPTEEAR
jgi:hypothetical protein